MDSVAEAPETAIPLDSLGGALRRLRLNKGMSQRQVADAAGIDYGNVSRYEGGKNLEVDTLGRLLAAMDVSLVDLAREMGLTLTQDQILGLLESMRAEMREEILRRSHNENGSS